MKNVAQFRQRIMPALQQRSNVERTSIITAVAAGGCLLIQPSAKPNEPRTHGGIPATIVGEAVRLTSPNFVLDSTGGGVA